MKKAQGTIELGDWSAPCCIHDLAKVETSEDLENARTEIPFAGAWGTLQEAINDLVNRKNYSRDTDWSDDIAYAKEHFDMTPDPVSSASD